MRQLDHAIMVKNKHLIEEAMHRIVVLARMLSLVMYLSLSVPHIRRLYIHLNLGPASRALSSVTLCGQNASQELASQGPIPDRAVLLLRQVSHLIYNADTVIEGMHQRTDEVLIGETLKQNILALVMCSCAFWCHLSS